MRLLSMLAAGVLCAGLLLAGGAPEARADSGRTAISRSADAAALPGTPAEAAEYERRESESPEVRDFAGGEMVIGVSIGAVLLVVLVVVIVLLLRD